MLQNSVRDEKDIAIELASSIVPDLAEFLKIPLNPHKLRPRSSTVRQLFFLANYRTYLANTWRTQAKFARVRANSSGVRRELANSSPKKVFNFDYRVRVRVRVMVRLRVEVRVRVMVRLRVESWGNRNPNHNHNSDPNLKPNPKPSPK